MGRAAWAIIIIGAVAGFLASPLRTRLSQYHVYVGQPVTLTTHVTPSAEWRQLAIDWYDASGFLISSTRRQLDELESGGQFFSTIRPQGDPGQWHVTVMLIAAQDRLAAHTTERFEVIGH